MQTSTLHIQPHLDSRPQSTTGKFLSKSCTRSHSSLREKMEILWETTSVNQATQTISANQIKSVPSMANRFPPPLNRLNREKNWQRWCFRFMRHFEFHAYSRPELSSRFSQKLVLCQRRLTARCRKTDTNTKFRRALTNKRRLSSDHAHVCTCQFLADCPPTFASLSARKQCESIFVSVLHTNPRQLFNTEQAIRLLLSVC
jgi:hypothetical protein